MQRKCHHMFDATVSVSLLRGFFVLFFWCISWLLFKTFRKESDESVGFSSRKKFACFFCFVFYSKVRLTKRDTKTLSQIPTRGALGLGEWRAVTAGGVWSVFQALPVSVA